MKIAVISSQVIVCPPPGYAGLEMITWLQAKGLAERGHDVYLVAPDGSTCPGVTMIHCGPPGQWDEKKGYERVWKQYAEMDVLIDSSWSKWSYIGKQEGWLHAPVLGVLHAPVDGMFRSLPVGVDKPSFVCISKDQASHFEALFGRPCRYAYNGCDTQFYSPLGIPRSDRYLFLARFSAIKGPDLCIEACKRADVGVDMIGDTTITGEPELLARCQAAADGKQIKIIGTCTRGEATYYFSQARALIHLTQKYREPFGLSPVEAQLCCCPVLAWNYGAMKETVEHGKTGYLVNSLDEAVDILKAGLLDKLDRNYCRQWALQFSVENMISRYADLCSEAKETGGW